MAIEKKLSIYFDDGTYEYFKCHKNPFVFYYDISVGRKTKYAGTLRIRISKEVIAGRNVSYLSFDHKTFSITDSLFFDSVEGDIVFTLETENVFELYNEFYIFLNGSTMDYNYIYSHYKTSKYCNMRCFYCNSYAIDSFERNFIKYDYFIKKLLKIPTSKTKHFDLDFCIMGGEPTLNFEEFSNTIKYHENICNFLSKKTSRMNLYSNCVTQNLVTCIDEVINSKYIEMVTLISSVDTANLEKSEKFRNRKEIELFEKNMNILKHYDSKKLRRAINLMYVDIETSENMIEYMKDNFDISHIKVAFDHNNNEKKYLKNQMKLGPILRTYGNSLGIENLKKSHYNLIPYFFRICDNGEVVYDLKLSARTENKNVVSIYENEFDF